jgi:hypothetical protein
MHGEPLLAFQSLFHLRMIFSEKRYPLFGIMRPAAFLILRVSRKRTAKSAALAYHGKIMHPEQSGRNGLNLSPAAPPVDCYA